MAICQESVRLALAPCLGVSLQSATAGFSCDPRMALGAGLRPVGRVRLGSDSALVAGAETGPNGHLPDAFSSLPDAFLRLADTAFRGLADPGGARI